MYLYNLIQNKLYRKNNVYVFLLLFLDTISCVPKVKNHLFATVFSDFHLANSLHIIQHSVSVQNYTGLTTVFLIKLTILL